MYNNAEVDLSKTLDYVLGTELLVYTNGEAIAYSVDNTNVFTANVNADGYAVIKYDAFADANAKTVSINAYFAIDDDKETVNSKDTRDAYFTVNGIAPKFDFAIDNGGTISFGAGKTDFEDNKWAVGTAKVSSNINGTVVVTKNGVAGDPIEVVAGAEAVALTTNFNEVGVYVVTFTTDDLGTADPVFATLNRTYNVAPVITGINILAPDGSVFAEYTLEEAKAGIDYYESYGVQVVATGATSYKAYFSNSGNPATTENTDYVFTNTDGKFDAVDTSTNNSTFAYCANESAETTKLSIAAISTVSENSELNVNEKIELNYVALPTIASVYETGYVDNAFVLKAPFAETNTLVYMKNGSVKVNKGTADNISATLNDEAIENKNIGVYTDYFVIVMPETVAEGSVLEITPIKTVKVDGEDIPVNGVPVNVTIHNEPMPTIKAVSPSNTVNYAEGQTDIEVEAENATGVVYYYSKDSANVTYKNVKAGTVTDINAALSSTSIYPTVYIGALPYKTVTVGDKEITVWGAESELEKITASFVDLPKVTAAKTITFSNEDYSADVTATAGNNIEVVLEFELPNNTVSKKTTTFTGKSTIDLTEVFVADSKSTGFCCSNSYTDNQA